MNAYRLVFDDSLLDEIRDSYYRELDPILSNPANGRLFQGGRVVHQPLGADNSEYYAVSFLDYPLLWLSCNTNRSHGIYQRFLDALNIDGEIRQLVDHDSKIILYSGALTVGEYSPAPSWHVDYKPGANAYSLLTPLFELDPGHGDLLYRMGDGQTGTYCYTQGEGIMFGDGFYHCTEPYEKTGHLRVLVTIQFGTDKMQYWDVLRQTVESQSDYLILPCGHQLGHCSCTSRADAPPSKAERAEKT